MDHKKACYYDVFVVREKYYPLEITQAVGTEAQESTLVHQRVPPNTVCLMSLVAVNGQRGRMILFVIVKHEKISTRTIWRNEICMCNCGDISVLKHEKMLCANYSKVIMILAPRLLGFLWWVDVGCFHDGFSPLL